MHPWLPVPQGPAVDIGLTRRGQKSKTLYSVSDEREVLRAVAGLLPPFLQRKLSHSRRPISRSGGGAHTWETEAFFTNGPIAIVRIYAVPPNGNRAALMSAMFNLKDFRKLERDVPPSRPSQAKPPHQP